MTIGRDSVSGGGAVLATLLWIPFRGIVNGLKRPREAKWGRQLFLLVVGLTVGGMVFGLLRLVFAYFYRQPVIGPLLVGRMFSMTFLVFLFMLIYSNILSSISSHFMSRDLSLLHSGPIRPLMIFLAKAFEALVGSSWMVVFICVPFYAAFGSVKEVSWSFYVYAGVATVPFLLIPAAFGMALNTGLMRLFPARRFREVMMMVGTIMFCCLIAVFRYLELERMVNPEDEMQVLDFMKMLAAPTAAYLPSAWAGNAIVAASNVAKDPLAYWKNLGWLVGTAAIMWATCLAMASKWYAGAWQQANESMGVKRGVRLARSWLLTRGGAYLAILVKDAKVFVRDPSQWGQMLLLFFLVVIYLSVLAKIPPGVSLGLRSLLFFMNLGYIGLILTAVAGRFLFPLVSLEGTSFELLQAAPISMERYLWTRLVAGITPLLLLAVALAVFSVPLLKVDMFMASIAVYSVIAMTLAISALAVGLGAAFAKFRISNPEEIVTSAGGFVYMALAFLYVVAILLIEAQPVRLYYFSTLFGHPFEDDLLVVGAIVLVGIMTIGCVVASVKFGARSLDAREI